MNKGLVLYIAVVFCAFALVISGCDKSKESKVTQSSSEGKSKKTVLSKEAEDHFKKGHAALKEKKLDQAIKEFEETVKLSPDTAVGHYWLGNAYFYNKQLDKATEEFKKMTEMEPDNFRGPAMLGKTYSMKKETAEMAEEQLKKALELNPDHLETHFDLGRVYAMKGDTSKAMAEFGFIFRNEANFAVYHLEMGRIFEGMKAFDKAEKEYQRALMLNPNFDRAKEALNNLKKQKK
jgi:tetratricopeptide (TPR) repeat protein